MTCVMLTPKLEELHLELQFPQGALHEGSRWAEREFILWVGRMRRIKSTRERHDGVEQPSGNNRDRMIGLVPSAPGLDQKLSMPPILHGHQMSEHGFDRAAVEDGRHL